jgi:hypothetical protein
VSRNSVNNNHNNNTNDDYHHIVSDYFRLIKEKDMDGLLNLFADDCVIYEPFSKVSSLYNSDGEPKKSFLKGKSEIESFLQIIMMGQWYEVHR